ncbi:Rho termination factor N-terminal domain-containing protein [Picosynechococcus sp. PCC 73109]|uniref:Rho termination factor N-terminal domain-containing protein n=1 Tax=Picosynechococcus sp. PCC 73109 TaxID=374982 RepID=UPI0007458088|nr:Rho termination factor N-terminal domain-containing protein [Picosynechococcus sp. PCC 73109]AMA10635.1 hypothetical protein AWQ23_14400 [Picosynechococcus sp. PCC 73109]
MTLIITATFFAASAYFFAALICFIHDSIAARRRPATPTVPKPAPITVAPTTPQNRFEGMSIRQLKKAASQAKVKGYSSMTKAKLIAALG